MKSNRRLAQTLSAAFALVVMGVIWINFAPARFGGQVEYVIINGNSMEPKFHLGDLVILQQASSYQIGDIATYRHPEVGPIIHRIIARDGDQFVLQGDNNTWIDSYRPVQAEMIGKLWIHIPFAGKVIEQLRTPWVMALLAAIIAGTFFSGTFTKKGRPGQPHQRRQRPAQREHRAMNNLDKNKADVLFLLATVAIASGLLALFAFSRPVSRTASENISYDQIGEFSYSAAAPPGIYATDNVQTGEPVFRRLINQVAVNFDYRIASDLPGNVQGTYRLIAEISHNNGWLWEIELQPETAFSGSTFSTGGTIDLSQVQALTDGLEQQTGLQHQSYALALKPEVNITGTMAGESLQDNFSPRLVFYLDELQMQLAGDVRVSDNPLHPSKTGVLTLPKTEPNTISILGFQLKISTARIIAVIGLILSLGGLGVFGVMMFRSSHGDEAALIRSKHSSLLVTVRDTNWLEPDAGVVEVTAFEDLVKIAEREGQMILHCPQQATHQYFVQDNNITYLYQFAAGDDDEDSPQMETAKQ